MKQIAILFLALTFGLSACNADDKEVAIKVAFIGEITEFIK